MRILVQRVKSAEVTVEKKCVAQIDRGLLLFVGVGREDKQKDIEYLCRKVQNLRIFNDGQGKMNLNVKQVSGQVLSVSQFTLYADVRKGNRPGFDLSADPQMALEYWARFNELMRKSELAVKEGIFGAHMEVHLINDGPVTVWLDSCQMRG